LLAYVFSHRPASGVDLQAYEDSLRKFHGALADAAPSGFISSSTFKTGDMFSDWYMVESSAALDLINDAAVSGARSPAHDAAARMAIDGVGKLLKLHAGEYFAGSGFEIRFAKPPGMGYADLYARLQSWTGAPEVSLWRRMMVLGPPPEFTILTPSKLELPVEMGPEVVRREPI
jgi:hypothetical protein